MFRGEKLFGRKGLPIGSPMSSDSSGPSQADVPAAMPGDGPQAIDDDYEAKLRAFIGPNADAYMDLKQRKTTNTQARKWCWMGFFFPMVWLFYRKLFIEGIAIFLIPAAILFLFPALDKINIAFGVMILMFGTSYYLSRAESKVKSIIDMDLPPEDELALLEKSGGVSKIGAGFALAFTLALIAIIIMAASLESQV